MAQSLYQALRRTYSQAQIHVIAPAWSRPLLTRMPEIDRIIELDIAHGELGLGKRYRLARSLRGEQYSHALVLPRSFKSALVPWWAGIPVRIGDRGEHRYGLLNKILPSNKDKSIPNVCNYLRYMDLQVDITTVKKEYSPCLTVDEFKQKALLASHEISIDAPLVACMVGAEYGLSKQWPIKHFASLIDQCHAAGLQVCILGSKKDVPTSKLIENKVTAPLHNLCGKTGLIDVVDILAACRVAVSNDSGLMHIAAAVNVPTIAMYGATTPVYTPPLQTQAKSFYLKLACSPCWQRQCRYDHYRCLQDILPQDVFATVEKFMAYKK